MTSLGDSAILEAHDGPADVKSSIHRLSLDFGMLNLIGTGVVSSFFRARLAQS